MDITINPNHIIEVDLTTNDSVTEICSEHDNAIEVDIVIDKDLQVVVDGVTHIDVDIQFQGIQGPIGPEGKVNYSTVDW